MTPAEAATLLAVAAAFDNRRADEAASIAWAAALDGLGVTDCRDAIVAHYRASSEWLMPAMVRTAVRRVRAKRIEEHPPLYPPPGLTEAEERAWLADARRRVGDGEHIDCSRAYGQIEQRDIPALRAALHALARSPTELDPDPGSGVGPLGHPASVSDGEVR